MIHEPMPVYNATQFPGPECMVDLITEHSFDSQATWVIDVLILFFDMSAMGFCTTRHCQASGPLVQESNVCTVASTMNRGEERVKYGLIV